MTPDWLAQLAPDHAPPRAGWFPPALGWWLAVACALLLAALVASIVKWWLEPHRRLRRAAMRELRRIGASPLQGAEAARAIENLLRRHAVALHGRERVARLTGAGWLEFAGASGAGALAGEAGRSLLATAFGRRPSSGVDRDQWLEAAEQLIRQSGRAAPVPAAPARAPIRERA